MSSSTLMDPPQDDLGAQDPPGQPPDGGGGNGGDGAPEPNHGTHMAILTIWISLAPVLMAFGALVTSYIVRRNLGNGWAASPVPPLLWVNTVMLLGSSLLLERARQQMARNINEAPWLWASLIAGSLFVVGQIIAWKLWLDSGVLFNSNTYASFFYLLTGVHALHVSAGLGGLRLAIYWPEGKYDTSRQVAVKVAAIFWHFLGILWMILLVLLTVWS